MAFRTTSIMAGFILMCHFFLHGEPVKPGNKCICTTYQVKKTGAQIEIDGHITEKAWENALEIDVDNEIIPAENIEAPVKTKCLLLYDDNNFYVAFKAYDPNPSEIRAHLSDRDKIGNDDMLGIILDTFNDQNRGFAFFSNPLGIQFDQIFSDGGNSVDTSWDAIWNSMGHIDANGYEVEMAIPFRVLQFPRGVDTHTWRFLPLRIYPRSQRHEISNFNHDRGNPCLLCQTNQLTGIQNVSAGKSIEVDPTITTFRTDERTVFPAGPLIKKNAKIEAGISASWGFTTNLTLSATVNPDFSQVEADIVQLDINKPFDPQYAEKRPFFMEGKDFFTTLIDAVYTRNLVDPAWGVKISGKEGKNALGFFLSHDKKTNLLLPGADNSDPKMLEGESSAAVIRYRRDIGTSSTIGILFTGRAGTDYYNWLGGIDGLLRVAGSDMIRFQALGSSSRYPLSQEQEGMQKNPGMTGYGLNLIYQREARNYGWKLSYENFSPDFRADMGFVPRVNLWKNLIESHYIFWGSQNSFFSQFYVGADFSQAKKHGGDLLERKAQITVSCEMPLQSNLFLNAGKQKKIFNSSEYNQDFLYFSFGFRPSGNFSVGCDGSIRDDIDYENSRAGKALEIAPWMEYNLGKCLQGSISYIYSQLDVDLGQLFRAHVFQAKLLYHFNSRTFLRAILQYTNITKDVTLYLDSVEPEYRLLFKQFLFSYKINPRTVLFLGYSDNYKGLLHVPLKQLNRTFFLKIGYALSI